MALGNFNSLIANQAGSVCNGVFISPLGVHVRAYKNWLYISDEKAWHEGVPYIQPTIMEVRSGEIEYKDVCIVAKRSDYQSSLYFAVWVPHWRNHGQLTGMAGICAYAYQGDQEHEIDERQVCEFRKALQQTRTLDVPIPNLFCELTLPLEFSSNQGVEYLHSHLSNKNLDEYTIGDGT